MPGIAFSTSIVWYLQQKVKIATRNTNFTPFSCRHMHPLQPFSSVIRLCLRRSSSAVPSNLQPCLHHCVAATNLHNQICKPLVQFKLKWKTVKFLWSVVAHPLSINDIEFLQVAHLCVNSPKFQSFTHTSGPPQGYCRWTPRGPPRQVPRILPSLSLLSNPNRSFIGLKPLLSRQKCTQTMWENWKFYKLPSMTTGIW